MLRIAVVTPIFPNSAEPYRGMPVYQTVLELQRLAEVSVLCPIASYPDHKLFHPRAAHYSAYTKISTDYAPEGISPRYLLYPSLPAVGRYFNGFSAQRAVTPWLRKIKPDVILAYWIYPEGYGAVRAARKMGVPAVVGSRGSDLRLSNPITRRLCHTALRNSSQVIVVSSEQRGLAEAAGVQPERLHVVLNGVNSSIFRLQDQAEARRRLGIEGGPVILFVGWLSPTKGLPELLDAALALAPEFPRLTLACVGEGPLEAQLRAANTGSALAGRVLVLGRRTSPEIADWLAASDLLCLPSHAEGCPNVILEALSCGRPVVASNVGGIPEMLNLECGIQVPPGSPAELRRALKAALSRDWDHSDIASHWGRSWTDVARRTLEICRLAASEYGRAASSRSA